MADIVAPSSNRQDSNPPTTGIEDTNTAPPRNENSTAAPKPQANLFQLAVCSLSLTEAASAVSNALADSNTKLSSEELLNLANQTYFLTLKSLFADQKNILVKYKGEVIKLDIEQIEQSDLKRIADKFQPLASLSTEEHSKEGHTHEHGEGGIVIDLDEAVHGAYAATKYLMSAMQGNPSAIWAEFKHEALDMKLDALNHTGQEMLSDGIGEFAAAVGISAIMVPLAFLAVKAGIEEFSHAKHALGILKHQRIALSDRKKILEKSAGAIQSKSLNTQIELTNSQLKTHKVAERLTKDDKAIGIASFCSGMSIGLKAVSDIVFKVTSSVQGALAGKSAFNLAQTVQIGTATGTGATILGAASTFFLGPLAGFFATTLGAYFVHKTATKRAQLKKNYIQVKEDFKSTGTSTPFHSFMQKQYNKRSKFFTRFSRWNKAFLIGSGLYAASATTKAILTGIAVAGAAALVSNPIGIATLAAVGTAGAVVMGLGSYCFIRGHGKQGKYTGVTAADHSLVDREFLVHQQLIDKEKGIKLAGNCLGRLDARKNAIRNFLNEAAKASSNDTKKKLSPHKQPNPTETQPRLTVWKRLQGQALTEKNITNYIKKDEGKNALKELIINDLNAEKEYLEKKLEQHGHLEVEGSLFEDQFKAAGQTKKDELLQGFVAHLLTADQKHGQDQIRLLKIGKILEEIQSTPPNTQKILEYLDQKIDAKDEKDAKHIDKQLAHHLLHTIDSDLRQARGVLFETQLQASASNSKSSKGKVKIENPVKTNDTEKEALLQAANVKLKNNTITAAKTTHSLFAQAF